MGKIILVLAALMVSGCNAELASSSASVSDNKDVIEACTFSGVHTTGATNADNTHYYNCQTASGSKSLNITIGANDYGIHLTGSSTASSGFYATTDVPSLCKVSLWSGTLGGNELSSISLKNKFMNSFTFESDSYTCSYY